MGWVYFSDCNKKDKFSLIDGNNCTKFLRQYKEKFPNGFMIVAEICYNGKLKLKKGVCKAKIRPPFYPEYFKTNF